MAILTPHKFLTNPSIHVACLTTDAHHPIARSTFLPHQTFHARSSLHLRRCLRPHKSQYKLLGLPLSSALAVGKTTPSKTSVLNRNRTQMALTTVTGVQVETAMFPPAVTPPGSEKTLFLGGAGVRGLEIQGKFVKFTAIGVYLEDNAVKWLAGKWKGKSAEELTESVEFFRDIVTGPFEKFTRVTMILPLTGPQYSEKVSANCVAIWKALGVYTDAEENAIEKFIEVFKDQNFPPGSSILFTLSPAGSLKISFSKGESLPEKENVVIKNKLLLEAVLESIIGKHGVSPAAKQSLASRLAELLKEKKTEDLPCGKDLEKMLGGGKAEQDVQQGS